MKMFSKRVIRYISQLALAIQKQSENRYLNVLNSVQDYNSLLKKKIKRVEEELKGYKGSFRMKNKKSSSFLRGSQPEGMLTKNRYARENENRSI